MVEFIEGSRTKWKSSRDALTGDEVKIGCLQRIADACESMARNHDQLVRERDWARTERDDYKRWLAQEKKRSAALRGMIGRMKRSGGAK